MRKFEIYRMCKHKCNKCLYWLARLGNLALEPIEFHRLLSIWVVLRVLIDGKLAGDKRIILIHVILPRWVTGGT